MRHGPPIALPRRRYGKRRSPIRRRDFPGRGPRRSARWIACARAGRAAPPVVQPTGFELVVNFETATALGLDPSLPLLLSAKKVLR